MLVMTLPSHASNGAIESVLAVAHQVTTTDNQGVVVDRQGAAADCQQTDAGRQGATADCQGAIADRQGATVDHHGVVTDRQGADAGRQDVLLLAASRPKKALAMRCVDGGSHRS
jgi:hypothetical protein